MTPDKIFVMIGGIFGIVFTYWFFLRKKDEIVIAQDNIDILVHGGYKPSTVSIPYGKTTKLIFHRVDSNSCLEEVVISDFKIRKFLPLHKKESIEITPSKKGEFPFSCGMNMFHGKLIVT